MSFLTTTIWLCQRACVVILDHMITSEQCRTARAMLGWTLGQLGKASKVNEATVRRFELGQRKPIAVTIDAIQRALEGAGVVFIPENGGGAGVRRKMPAAPAAHD
jgi:transcriptional regulator with XRE-family HTH domain